MRPRGGDHLGVDLPGAVVGDQRAASLSLLDRRKLGRGWTEALMVNNEPRVDPHGEDEASARLRAVRDARRLTGLHEGHAWRRRREPRVLLVVRHEVFARTDDFGHRTLWREVGPASLDATWRERWRERDVVPGWIETRDVGEDRGLDDGEVDWFHVDDHTDPSGGREVTAYEHVSLWVGRHLVTLTLRHPFELDVDPDLVRAVETARTRLASQD